MSGESPKVSAVVIAYNDEPNIRGCMETLTWADEIVVVDSHSTDATDGWQGHTLAQPRGSLRSL